MIRVFAFWFLILVFAFRFLGTFDISIRSGFGRLGL